MHDSRVLRSRLQSTVRTVSRQKRTEKIVRRDSIAVVDDTGSETLICTYNAVIAIGLFARDYQCVSMVL